MSNSELATHSLLRLEVLVSQGPDPELAEKMQLFGQFVGSWETDWVSYTPDGAHQSGSGEIHFGWVLEGRAIQDVWIFPSREERQSKGLPLDEYGTTIRFYDATLDGWRVIWISLVNRNVRVFTARPVGDEIVVEGTYGQGQPVQWIFSKITPQSFHWRNMIWEDSGQKWRLQEEVMARRLE